MKISLWPNYVVDRLCERAAIFHKSSFRGGVEAAPLKKPMGIRASNRTEKHDLRTIVHRTVGFHRPQKLGTHPLISRDRIDNNVLDYSERLSFEHHVVTQLDKCRSANQTVTHCNEQRRLRILGKFSYVFGKNTASRVSHQLIV
ncbi:hypothetical protein ABIC89_002442 [Variovorax boronicumulans]|uniref:hypothetical protein n=1 Tax=Variovorax boronicumulans TaxID=436515 RepID=UPI00347DA6C7